MTLSIHDYGITLPNSCIIVHGDGANIKHIFTDIRVEMHECDPGRTNGRAFAGQFGFIEFSTEFRLPRHVHIARASDSAATERRFIAERIFVLNGVAVVELNGEIYVIPPKSLVTIAPGVPHTWTACPAGVSIPPVEAGTEPAMKDFTSSGTFLMLYEYEEPTAFFPTAQTDTLTKVEEYERCDDLNSIRIPKLSAVDVRDRCWFVRGRSLLKPREREIRG